LLADPPATGSAPPDSGDPVQPLMRPGRLRTAVASWLALEWIPTSRVPFMASTASGNAHDHRRGWHNRPVTRRPPLLREGRSHQPRRPGGQRRYAAADLAWIEFLLRLCDTGMSIADMQQSAGLRRRGNSTVPDRLALLRQHRARLTGRIRQLQASGRALDDNISHYEQLLEDA
jgi:DNA-binding transcriptional MerR regulator